MTTIQITCDTLTSVPKPNSNYTLATLKNPQIEDKDNLLDCFVTDCQAFEMMTDAISEMPAWDDYIRNHARECFDMLLPEEVETAKFYKEALNEMDEEIIEEHLRNNLHFTDDPKMLEEITARHDLFTEKDVETAVDDALAEAGVKP